MKIGDKIKIIKVNENRECFKYTNMYLKSRIGRVGIIVEILEDVPERSVIASIDGINIWMHEDEYEMVK